MSTSDAIKRVVEHFGGTVAAANGLGLKSYQVLQQWAANGVPAKHRARIELKTRGAVTVDEFGSDVVWHRIKDKAWPHPKGRPLQDVAAAAEAA